LNLTKELHVKLLIFAALLAASAAHAGTAFFKYERITGLTKQCVYDYLGSEYVITLQSYQLCPITITV
jgi:hypothetical protein